MHLYHNSRESRFRTPFGAAPTGAEVSLSIEAEVPQGTEVLVRLWQSGESLVPMTEEEPGLFRCSFPEKLGTLRLQPWRRASRSSTSCMVIPSRTMYALISFLVSIQTPLSIGFRLPVSRTSFLPPLSPAALFSR